MQTPLQARILDQLRQLLGEALEPGDRINEAEISDQLGVSRTPVRRALQQLQAEGAVDYEQNRGFRLADISLLLKNSEAEQEMLLDERVMRDMAIGELRSVISERALMQKYAVANGVLMSTLRRLMRDHLVEPSPGRGWIFADVGAEALANGYRFRQIIEPAAILSDDYAIDAPALEAIDADHAYAIDNLETMDRRRLFDLDARFHRLVAQGARTADLVDAIERQNNIRRVTEYLGFLRLERLRQSMIEHRGIIAALLQGERQTAAALMRIHLQISRDETFVHMEQDLDRVRGGEVRLSGDEAG
ncbi:MAG: GntR family transcriptional regulator [Mesorhizobium sp.]|uniref:GntR family transcriptional regulator n=1 Tax=Mesorhizobium sp. TaxID=1871066 RepID=UPI001ACE19A5|nr:GntR family transcriptional regulator [Mesorhizobium sp.]MBN9221159.1 GntR family transcriptional regulator [Mesorhizobium sp.]